VNCFNILGEIKAQSQQVNALSVRPSEMYGNWERVVATIDSGANAPVMPPSFGQAYSVVESEGSKAGNSYLSASGGIIPNWGQKMLPVVTKEGTTRGYCSQVADVTTMLQSVIHLNRTGHGVWLDGDQSFMVNKHTGEVNQIDHNGKDFTMEMWVIPPDELSAYVEGVDPGTPFARRHP